MSDSKRSNRWGVVLAGGDGSRLRRLTKHISGDDRPKQFCSLYGSATLLEHTRQRAERSIRPGRILYSLNRDHEKYYMPLLADSTSQCVVQPQNRGTAPGILSTLVVIARQNPCAVVAFLPSDHYYSNEATFTHALDNAFDLAENEPDSIVLLGAKPTGPEEGYGWLETGAAVARHADTFRIHSFHEKPSANMANYYWQSGMLWNTFVMAGNAMAFLEAIYSGMPSEFKAFQRAPVAAGDGGSILLDKELYSGLETIDFSRRILAAETSRLIVHGLSNVVWSDLGDSRRAIEALAWAGEDPLWAQSWRAMQHAIRQQGSLLAAQ